MSTDSSGKYGGEEMCSSSKRFKYDNSCSGMRGKFPVISEDAEAPSSEEEEEEEEEGGDGVMAHVNQFFAELHVDQSRQRRRLLEGRAVKVRLARPAPSSLCKCVWLAKLSQCKLSVAFQLTPLRLVCIVVYFNLSLSLGGSPQHAILQETVVYCSSFPLLSQVPRRRSLLPSHLHSVMGNANLRLARGDIPAAIELCMEVVRQGMYLCMRKKTLRLLHS